MNGQAEEKVWGWSLVKQRPPHPPMGLCEEVHCEPAHMRLCTSAGTCWAQIPREFVWATPGGPHKVSHPRLKPGTPFSQLRTCDLSTLTPRPPHHPVSHSIAKGKELGRGMGMWRGAQPLLCRLLTGSLTLIHCLICVSLSFLSCKIIATL